MKIYLLALLLSTTCLHAAEPRTTSAALQPPNARKPAPPFHLLDAAGRAAALSNYHGKILLLNFWATTCGGCVFELPWFMELDQAYKQKGVDVVGVSMDISYEDLKNAKEAWSRVNPFVAARHIPYQILMEDDAITKSYDMQAIPATYLIDTKGRIAATYIGIVNKPNLEANIKLLLAEPQPR